MFSVDGFGWTIPFDATRSIRIQDTDISGQLLNGRMFHDVEGTYFDYEITLTPDPHQMGEYYALLDILIQPVDGHQFVFPYNGETVQVTAKVENPKDVYVDLHNGQVYWRGLTFTAAANHPSIEPGLNHAISRGLTPLPDVAEPQIGDTYTYTANGWVAVDTEG